MMVNQTEFPFYGWRSVLEQLKTTKVDGVCIESLCRMYCASDENKLKRYENTIFGANTNDSKDLCTHCALVNKAHKHSASINKHFLEGIEDPALEGFGLEGVYGESTTFH